MTIHKKWFKRILIGLLVISGIAVVANLAHYFTVEASHAALLRTAAEFGEPASSLPTPTVDAIQWLILFSITADVICIVGAVRVLKLGSRARHLLILGLFLALFASAAKAVYYSSLLNESMQHIQTFSSSIPSEGAGQMKALAIFEKVASAKRVQVLLFVANAVFYGALIWIFLAKKEEGLVASDAA